MIELNNQKKKFQEPSIDDNIKRIAELFHEFVVTLEEMANSKDPNNRTEEQQA